MLYYILPYFFLIFISIFVLKLRTKKLAFFLFVAILPAFFLVILRGNVGTDIEIYLRIFTFLKHGDENPLKFEPGFTILSKAIILFTKNERVAINIISSLTTVLLVSCFSKRKSDIIIFSFLIFPFFYYDMTMNGIRYGLSFSLAAMAIHNLYVQKYIKFTLWGLAAISIQYSTIIIFAPFLLSFLTKKQLLYLSILLLSVGSYLFSFEYFVNKFNAYGTLYSPSIMSGLSSLLPSLLLIFMIALYHKKSLYTKLFYYLIGMSVGGYLLTFISYAGLRIQTVVLFLIILYLKGIIENIRRRQEVFTIIFLIGILGFIFRLRNFSSSVEGVTTPFIPYHFFWQI